MAEASNQPNWPPFPPRAAAFFSSVAARATRRAALANEMMQDFKRLIAAKLRK
jgi:hypothetical protein